jgi:hypothetical protein
MNRLRSLIMLPLAAAAFLAAVARGQLTCETAQPVGLGETPFASLLPFPAFDAPGSCSTHGTFVPRIEHAVYFRFTAPSSGWYAFGAKGDAACGAWLLLASDCGTSVSFPSYHAASMPAPEGSPPCAPVETWNTVSARLAAGESRIIAVGYGDVQCAGNGRLRIARIGDSLVDGAQPLSVGANPFVTPAWAPPISTGCWWDERIHNTVAFTFTPAVSGTYRIDTCGTEFSAIGTGTDPELRLATTNWTLGGGSCASGSGTRQIRQFTAGTTYYVCLGTQYWQGTVVQPCQQRQVSVEFVPPCPADFNDDDTTDGIDLGILLAAWGTPARDITGDGTTDGVDLGILLAMWGACPEG